MKGLDRRTLLCLSLVACCLSLEALAAEELPSLFRGVVVADSPLGVRVVSVEESSQAFLADLRPEDIIVRVHGQDIRSIDEFATLSTSLRGHAAAAAVVVFRRGLPRELRLHLYSVPILTTWGLEFIPDHDLRFAQAQVGRDHWIRMARGFEEAGKPAEALSACLNALHLVPADVEAALTVAGLFSRLSRQQMSAGALAEGTTSLRKALAVTERLFDHPLSDEQLRSVQDQLRSTLQALREARASAVER